MSNQHAESGEPLVYRCYDEGPMRSLVKHDTWPVDMALALLCDIDPYTSDLSDIQQQFREAADDLYRLAKRSGEFGRSLPERRLSTFQDYLILFSLEKRNPKNLSREKVVEHFSKVYSGLISRDNWLGDPDDFFDVPARRRQAITNLQHYYSLFLSNPKHVAEDRFSPAYFIDWAASKGFDIPWLAWAEHNGHLDKGTESARPEPKATPTKPIKQTSSTKKDEREEERKQEIAELQTAARKHAVKLKMDGIHPKFITVARICRDLLKESFSSGATFRSRWGTIDGMRSHLKGDDHPKRNDEFENAKPDRAKFNP